VVACDTAALQRLAPGVDINAGGQEGITLLGLAVERAFEQPECAQGSRLAVVKQLLALGAKADSGLDSALKIDDIAFLTTLLDAGANPNQRTQFDQPILFGRLSALPVASMNLMIERGVDVNAVSYGNSLSFELALKRRWDLLALIIEHGADAYKRRDDGRYAANEIAEQIVNLEKEGKELPADLLRVRDLLDKQPKPTATGS
jgi:ankyrin repeat protein